MEELNKVEKLIGHLKEYTETRLDLAFLNAQDRITDIISSLVSSIIGAVLTIFIVLFASLGVALWLCQHFQSSFIGFLFVAGFYLVTMLLVMVNREKWIKFPLINVLIKKMNTHTHE
jgi:hypothetical protein